MSRLILTTPNSAQKVVDGLYKDLERRLEAGPSALCPVDLSLSFLNYVSCPVLWKMCSM